MTFGKNLTFAQLTNKKTLQSSSITTGQYIYYATSSYQLSTSSLYSNISFMPRTRNSITDATAEPQQPSSSAIDTSTHNDRSRAVTPPLQLTPPPAHIWVDHNTRPHLFIEEGGKRRLMCFEVEGTVVDYFLQSDSKFGHYITVRLSPEDILSIKNIVRGAPNHSEENFQWPIDNNVAKFKANPDPLLP